MRHSNYDKSPCVAVPGGTGACARGWAAVTDRLRARLAPRGAARAVLVVECYPGVD